jgi:hypothetical protein
MRDENLKHFNLVGGTVLALYMGHRKSIDLDLFSQETFDVIALEKYLIDIYGFNRWKISDVTLIGYINDIKIDCIRYDYPLIKPISIYDNIRLFSIHDIAAMKLMAISQNGTRLKDFVDVAYLSAKMSLKEMLDAFEIKYPNTNKMSAIKGLAYFNDIDFSTKIELNEGTFKWKEIEKRLNEMIKYPNKLFSNYPIAISK